MNNRGGRSGGAVSCDGGTVADMLSRARAFWILVVIIVVGIGVRSWQLPARSLWFDEAFSWRLIQFDVPELLTRAAHDVHPPLYYFLLKGWATVFGRSLLALRSLSVVFAGLTLGAVYLLTSTLGRSRGVGVVAALLVALAGFQIQFAWEARMYTLGTFLAVLSAWLLLRAVRSEPARLGWWLAYGVVVTLFAYTHYYALFSIVAQVVWLAGYLIVRTGGRVGELLQWRLVWYALAALAVAAVLYIPWLPTFVRQNAQVQASYWIPPIGGWSVPDTFYRLWLPTSLIPQHEGLVWIVLALVPLVGTLGLWGWLLVGRWRTKAQMRDGTWLVVLSGVLPFVGSIGLSLVTQSVYQDRFFVFAHVYVVIAFALVLWQLPWRWLRLMMTVIAVGGFALASVHWWVELDIMAKPGARAATAVIREQAQPGEPVVVSSPFIYFSILHHLTEPAAVVQPRLYSDTGELAHFAGGPILQRDDVVGRDVFATNSPRLWVVDTTGFGGTPLLIPAPWAVVQAVTFPEVFSHQGVVTVTEYARSSY